MVSRAIVSVLLAVLILGTAAVSKEAEKPLKPEAYAVKVLAPNGGEKWDENTSQVILWELSSATVPDSVRIKLIRKVGKDEQTSSKADRVLATIYKVNPGKWEWVKVGTVAEGLKIQVEAFYPKKKLVKDASDDYFSIVLPAISYIPPSLTVLSPNGGEVWKVGSKETIKWHLEEMKPEDLPRPEASLLFMVSLSRDGGETYEILVSDLSFATSEWEWALPDVVADKCLLKVSLVDQKSEELCKDVSDAYFRIVPSDGQH